MSVQIRDGLTGNIASVNKDNQLVTRSTSIDQRLKSTIDENYYEATTGKVTLTNATETGIIYVKNEDTNTDKILIVDKMFLDVFDSTGGSGSGTFYYYINPTITGGTDITLTNTNFGSNNSLTGTFKKSLTTISGTVWYMGQFTATSSLSVDEGKFAIPSGYSFLISVAAPTGNSSMAVSINVAMYLLDKELV